MNEHLEQINVFRFLPLFKEFTYAESFHVPSEGLRGQHLRIHKDGSINILEVCYGLRILQTLYEIVKRVKCCCVEKRRRRWGVFNKLNFAADERLSGWMFSKNTHNNHVFEMPVS